VNTADGGDRRRLQLLLDHMPDGVLAFDAAGLIEWINPAARLIFQRSAADTVGQPMQRLIPDFGSALVRAVEALPIGQAPAESPRITLEGRRPGGARFALELALVVWSDGQGKAGMCVCRDVSEADRIERMKREFVTMVSHELRTPLTSLRGSLALLTDGSFPDLPPDAQRLLRLAHDNGERLVTLVNDILDFEKLRAGALRMDFESLDLRDVARQSIDALDGMARLAGVRLVLHDDTGPHGDAPVRADAVRLVQVLANLMSNAIKHSPQGGAVTLRIQPRGERLRLTVSDQGEGVPADMLPRLFEPFEQARNPRHRKAGTGLGLAISRALMELMHGDIGLVEPRRGQGASFWIELAMDRDRPSTFGVLE
jgi:PAS domain S-box-containing protein